MNKEKYAEHLIGMVQIPTITNVDPDKLDLEAFSELHRYLEKTWPLIHSRMEREVIGKCALLYHLKGTGTMGRDPLMLIAHQDVVPVGDPSQWSYPPFEGQIHGGMIYGRGTTDSKCNIQAYMDALEELLEEGFEPDCDLYFGFGYNEESMAKIPAASLIAKTLQERGVTIGCLLDECGGIQSDGSRPLYATIYTSEKGYADLEISCTGQGGHSARPASRTPLGAVSEAICAIENHPLPARLTDTVARQLKNGASFLEDDELKNLCTDPYKNWDQIRPIMEKDPALNALIRTTAVATMAQGSTQANVIPSRATAVVNVRLLPGDTIEDVIASLKSVIPEDVEINVIQGTTPPPEQSTDTFGYHVIEELTREKYPEIPIIPQLLLGGTDSRYYADVCPSRSIYRFTHLSYDPRWENTAHMVNERIPVDILADNVSFYKKLMKKYLSNG